MVLFYVGIILLLIISIIELNPKRFKKGMPYLDTDKNSGVYLIISSVLVGIGSIVDRIFKLWIIQTPFNNIIILVGIVVILLGFFIRSKAIKELGSDFNYAVAPIKKLHTSGMYGTIRHPSYLGTLAYSLGVPLLFSSVIGLVLALFVLFSVFYRIKIEEGFLEKTIGDKYIKYKKDTYNIIPYIY